MNLMDVLTHKWDEKLVEACGGPELLKKLGSDPVHGGTFLGKISDWWVKKWGFNPGIIIFFVFGATTDTPFPRMFNCSLYWG